MRTRTPGSVLIPATHLVDLDTGVDALGVEGIHEGGAVGAGLVEGLLEEDRAADVLTEVGGGDEELAVPPAVLLDVLNANALEAGAARRVGLVHGEDALAGLGHLGLRAKRGGGSARGAR